MYYPFFRGKQYELIAIRENAKLLKDAGFVPIIEPVKESLGGLERSLAEVVGNGGNAILIINPTCGDCEKIAIQGLLDEKFAKEKGISAGVLVGAEADLKQILHLIAKNRDRDVTIIHCGYTDGGVLAKELRNCTNLHRHVFLEPFCGKLYRRHFGAGSRVLVRDGFQRRVNREHPPLESFSDLHVTYKEEGMNGFGDFLIVGDDFTEGGGPAYAVAIHVTAIDHSKDDEMFVHHFLSVRMDTPTDPAGKFAEAVAKLAHEVSRQGTPIGQTGAINEFLELHQKGHFPGLGYVKKLSMQHHLETLANYLKNAA